MAHHGIRYPRLSRLRRNNRLAHSHHGVGGALHRSDDQLNRDFQDGWSSEGLGSSGQLLGKRQTPTPVEDTTTAEATDVADAEAPTQTTSADATTALPTTAAEAATETSLTTTSDASTETTPTSVPTATSETTTTSASSTSTSETSSETTTADLSTTSIPQPSATSDLPGTTSVPSSTGALTTDSSEATQPVSTESASSSSDTASTPTILNTSDVSTSIPSSATSTSSESTTTTNSIPTVVSTDYSETNTFYGGGGGGSTWGGDGATTATGLDPISSATGTSAPSTGGSSLDSETKGKIAGGVVGGVAGVVMFIVLALLFLRRRRVSFQQSRGLPASDATGTGDENTTREEMASRRSSNDPLFSAAYFAPAFMKRWRESHQTTRTDSTLTSSGSERGFQKISGRKIPSVFQSGGDGYGGGFSEGSPTASEPSTIFPPGSPVHPRSPVSQPPPSTPYGMPLDTSYTREAEEAVIFRPSPARTPVAGSANVSLCNEPSISHVIPQSSTMPSIPQRQDLLGRSHPSFDGSRGSRFTESL
ncbi:hypothetical protein FE257_008046 [Aspergillus nanangensis]|uniref:Uncharacterized protein n=1 Tax=Aspergillus nanangensis TaxID=2582783 RepID=A0AAD4CM58_ASPNN|nr:hypothetical protein FE257_008046 [Aspergillus nanangensis]